MRGPAGAANRIHTRGFSGRWDELTPFELPPAAAVLVGDSAAAVRTVWTHATTARETLVAAASRAEAGLLDALREAGLAIVEAGGSEILRVAPPTVEREANPGRLWLLTSGSTGRPKQVAHTLDSLTTVRGDQPPRTWLCPYTPGAYAWWQVVTLSLRLPGQNVVFVESDQLDEWPDLALEQGVTAASGTPTFWRQALMRSGTTLAQVPLEQITLGGEPVDQGILDKLAEVFPNARISWIYASSEAGASIAVHDGSAGFPKAWLDRESPDRPKISVVDEELVLASNFRAEGIDAVLHTGDRVEFHDDRVLITGRIASDEINVGGSKASASKVRSVLLTHPAVAWAAVRGRKAPLVGTMVVADVVLQEGQQVDEAELVRHCAGQLADYAVPRRVRILDSIPIKESLKSDV